MADTTTQCHDAHMTATQQAPAGWYPDPEQTGQQRWWDGYRWAAPKVKTASASTYTGLGLVSLAGVLSLTSVIGMWGHIILTIAAIGCAIGGMTAVRHQKTNTTLAWTTIALSVLVIVFTMFGLGYYFNNN